MGLPLVNILSQDGKYEVFATSRMQQKSADIYWIQGNAHDLIFVRDSLLSQDYDVIVDFMNYKTLEFKERYELFLTHTSHYIFLSSARVYAPSDNMLDEKAPRILDVCKDELYLQKDSYDLAKARQEDLLNSSCFNNYSILRPSLTYNDDRLQFALFELNEWIYRVFDGNSILFPNEMRNVTTTMTHGKDVARLISKLILNEGSYGETFNISGGGSLTWNEILEVYSTTLERKLSRQVKLSFIEGAEQIAAKLNRNDQYKYARGINRVFSNLKIENLVGTIPYIPIEEGLATCLSNFLDSGRSISRPSCRIVAYFDRLAHEKTSLKCFESPKQRLGYILYRYFVSGL